MWPAARGFRRICQHWDGVILKVIYTKISYNVAEMRAVEYLTEIHLRTVGAKKYDWNAYR